jgi:prepilin-type N-terminal cleavage/methylation domain-containing protein
MKHLRLITQQGFTLIESVVAMVLLSIVSVVIISLNGNLFLNSSDMRGLHQSTQLLQSCVDQVMAIRKSSGFAATFHCDELNALNTGFTLSVSLKPTPDYCPSGLQCKQVLISVNKTGLSGGNPASVLLVNY